MTAQRELDCFDTDCPKCPLCGEDEYDMYDGGPLFVKDDSEELWCGSCEGTYIVTRNISYTTKPKGGWKEGV